MVNSDIPPYRKSTYELSLEGRLGVVEQYLSFLGSALRTQLPTLSLPEIKDRLNGPLPALQEHGAGTVHHEDVFAGHGPRFVARHNLAESVGERQRLLNLLPQVSGVARGFPDVEELLNVYAMEDHPRGYERNQATNSPELLTLMERLTQGNPSLPSHSSGRGEHCGRARLLRLESCGIRL